jgi:hypothetical protein
VGAVLVMETNMFINFISTDSIKNSNKNFSFLQSWGSGIPDPDSYPSRIADLKTSTEERGEKFFVEKPFFVATNCTKL